MPKSKKRTKKGTALITAIMLCAVFAAAIVGVGGFAIRQLNISKAYSDGLVAYYAAESGIEEGLLRYRFNKNAEVPYTIGPYTSDVLKKTPINGFRNYLNLNPSRGDSSNDGGEYGLHLGYNGVDMQPIYDLQVFYQQKYLGQDLESPFGIIDDADLRNDNYKNYPAYKIVKDESKTFTIPDDRGNLSLYWRWLATCTPGKIHALEVKVRVLDTDVTASGKDTYTMLFRDENCPVTNSYPATLNPGSPIVYSVGDLKAQMNIASLKVTEITIHPVGQTANADLVFGYSQFDGNAQVAGLSTTVRSIGYFRGTTREIIANIDRQSGTILDLFNYVLYKGGS